MLEKAIEFAKKVHEGQIDKAGKPYIYHCLRVMEMGQNEEEKILGVLHDVIEDGGHEVEREIYEIFGGKILENVKFLTRRKCEPYFDYIARFRKNEIVRQVKLNDLKDNLDVTRFDKLTEKHLSLLNRYIKAYNILKNPF